MVVHENLCVQRPPALLDKNASMGFTYILSCVLSFPTKDHPVKLHVFEDYSYGSMDWLLKGFAAHANNNYITLSWASSYIPTCSQITYTPYCTSQKQAEFLLCTSFLITQNCYPTVTSLGTTNLYKVPLKLYKKYM